MNKRELSKGVQWCAWCNSMLPSLRRRPYKITRVYVGGKFYCATGPREKFGRKNITASCYFKLLEANK